MGEASTRTRPTKTRPAGGRRRRLLRLGAAVLVATVLSGARPLGAAVPGANGMVAFASDGDGNLEPEGRGWRSAGAPNDRPATLPSLVYVHGDALVELLPDGSTRTVGMLLDSGEVRGAMVVRNSALVLASEGSSSHSLSGKRARFFSEVGGTGPLQLVARPDRAQVAYGTAFDVPAAEPSTGTRIGVLDLGGAREVASAPERLRVLGFTADGSGLWVAPATEDGSFAALRRLDIVTGGAEEVEAVEGTGLAVLSPDGLHLATGGGESRLAVYDLGTSPPSAKPLSLPHRPHHPSGALWSPDGRFLYVVLDQGERSDAPDAEVTLGLWRLDAGDGSARPLTSPLPAGTRLLDLSRDGRWLFSRPDGAEGTSRLDLSSGATEGLPVPAEAVVAGIGPQPDPAATERFAGPTVVINGIGPVKVGMTAAEASAAAQAEVADSGWEFGTDCFYYDVEGVPGLEFMVVDDQIVRADIDDPRYATRAGARIGSTEQEVLDLYPGQIEVSPHPYDERGHYLTLVPKDPAEDEYRIIFETDGERVTSFRSGFRDPVSWIEGCL